MKKVIYLLNGPNLNLLGKRNPGVYGKETLYDVVTMVTEAAEKLGCDIVPHQTNYEGKLIDWIQDAPINEISGIILNAGGLTHTSISLRDAVDFAREQGVPTIEVHISDIHARESFRHISFLTDVCIDQICGRGIEGYVDALNILIAHLSSEVE